MTCYFSNYSYEYNQLDKSEKEYLFGLSAFHPQHQEAGDFPIPNADIRDRIVQLMKSMLGKSKWRDLSSGKQDSIVSDFQEGQAVNWILKWYLEQEYSLYECKAESEGSQSEYDVVIQENTVPFCGIEIKRAGTSKRMKNYLDDIPNKKEDRSNVDKYLLINLFPISKHMDISRTYYLIQGYGPLSIHYHEFYGSNSAHVANIPAPIHKLENESSVGPLRLIFEELRLELNIPK